jgi:hypothetical protein
MLKNISKDRELKAFDIKLIPIIFNDLFYRAVDTLRLGYKNQ